MTSSSRGGGGGSCPVTTTNLLWKSKRSFEKVYYKVWLTLLQSATGVCHKVRQLFYYKVWLRLLQSATGITKCDWGYYKVRQVLQSATVITKCDSTITLGIFRSVMNWRMSVLKDFWPDILRENVAALERWPPLGGFSHRESSGIRPNLLSASERYSLWERSDRFERVDYIPKVWTFSTSNRTTSNPILEYRHK